MKHNILHIAVMASVICLAVSCSKQEIFAPSNTVRLNVGDVVAWDSPQTRSSETALQHQIAEDLWLTVNVSDNPLSACKDGETKGTNTTTASFETLYGTDDFGVYAEKTGDPTTVLIANTNFTKSGNTWVPAASTDWPDYATDWYAWAPMGTASLSSTGKTFTYSTPAVNSTSGEDILVAKVSDVASGRTEALDIAFDHALCEVKFVSGAGIPAGTLTSLSIGGISLTGTYDFTTGAWSGQSNSGTISLSTELLVSGDAGTALTSDSQTFFVIPQLCAAGASVSLTLDGETHTIALPDGFEFKGGELVTFSLGNNSLSLNGSVKMNYNATSGTRELYVTSNHPWKLQYTEDNGDTWTDAVANTTIDGWVSFDIVNGPASEDDLTLTATVAPATEDDIETTVIDVDHTKILREASAKGSQAAPYDLSMYSADGKSTTCNTANCYVISSPGWYAFPLVYGNAIKNGTVNEGSYHTEGTLSYFEAVDADGNTASITSPYIETVTGLSASSMSAAPLWEDLPGWAIVAENGCAVLTQEQASAKGLTGSPCGYIMFEVKKDNLEQGNALITLKSSKGTILWSWHLWVTDNDLTGKKFTNQDGNFSKRMMPVNLGWVDYKKDPTTTTNTYVEKTLLVRVVQVDGEKLLKSVESTVIRDEYSESSFRWLGGSTYYQWGRKDPFIRADIEEGRELPSYAISSSTSSPIVVAENDSGFSIADAIMNPNTAFMMSEYPDVWGHVWHNGAKSHFVSNLWNANLKNASVSYGLNDVLKTRTVKTVYDPCPAGFCVPQGDAFTGIILEKGTFCTGEPSKLNISKQYDRGLELYTDSTQSDTICFPTINLRFDQYPLCITPQANYMGQITYWTSIPVDINEHGWIVGHYVSMFESGEFSTTNNETAAGSQGTASCMSVRPVED